MNILDIYKEIKRSYKDYIGSFVSIKDERIRKEVSEAIKSEKLWPDALIQFNPNFASGIDVSQMIKNGFPIHKDLGLFFKNPFYKHQQEAIELGCQDKEFIVTSGTGSGKSRTFMATIFNYILQHQEDSINKTIAIIVYPMNALINSQSEELARYRQQYENATGKECPFTFAKYTGQEDSQVRERIQTTPPNIILTNYMMLELLMTRAGDEKRLRDCFLENLHYLIFDELHTYRGMQGSDVSFLIRRIKAQAKKPVLCFGTSATMVADDKLSYKEQRQKVAEVASCIFGSSYDINQVVDETLKVGLSNTNYSKEDILSAINSPNTKLEKIKSFKDHAIKAVLEGDVSLLFPKLISLQDARGGALSKCGYGIQFLLLVTLSILNKLQTISDQRGETGVFVNEDTGERSISVVLGLDEPEIHLHPYMQRSLIKYLNKVINNEDSDLKLLIKELFGIDKLDGQIIIATHSPSIILNDFKQIIRLYKEGTSTKIVSGTNLSLGEQLEKHLLLHFPFIKEAFFARCAIFVEGDSEYGSFPLFAKKCDIDLDDCGICVIQAGGDSVLQLIQLAEKFGIPCIGIRDSDGDNTPTSIPNLWKTTERDFEAELMKLIDIGREEVLCDILCEYDSEKQERILNAQALNKRAYKKYGYLTAPISTDLKLSDIDKTNITNLKAYYSTWFGINKSQPLGLLIGMKLSKSEIPQIYVNLIEQAKSLC